MRAALVSESKEEIPEGIAQLGEDGLAQYFSAVFDFEAELPEDMRSDPGSHHGLDLDSDYSWSDYSTELDDVEIQSSIDAIREEALRMDALLAMDQLETMKEEIKSFKRELARRKQEITEQRSLIKLKDDRLATLELERDLHKAEVDKLKSDLNKCTNNKTQMTRPQETTTIATSLAKVSTGGQQQAGEETTPDPFTDSPPLLAPTAGRFQIDSKPIHPSHTRVNKRSMELDVRKTPSRVPRSPSPSTSVPAIRNNKAKIQVEGFRPKKELASTLICRKTRSSPDNNENTLMRLSIRRILGPKQPGSSEATKDNDPVHRISLESQIEELRHRLRVSMDTSEELRRRLAKVTMYYESIIRRLQVRHNESKDGSRGLKKA